MLPIATTVANKKRIKINKLGYTSVRRTFFHITSATPSSRFNTRDKMNSKSDSRFTYCRTGIFTPSTFPSEMMLRSARRQTVLQTCASVAVCASPGKMNSRDARTERG